MEFLVPAMFTWHVYGWPLVASAVPVSASAVTSQMCINSWDFGACHVYTACLLLSRCCLHSRKFGLSWMCGLPKRVAWVIAVDFELVSSCEFLHLCWLSGEIHCSLLVAYCSSFLPPPSLLGCLTLFLLALCSSSLCWFPPALLWFCLLYMSDVH